MGRFKITIEIEAETAEDAERLGQRIEDDYSSHDAVALEVDESVTHGEGGREEGT